MFTRIYVKNISQINKKNEHRSTFLIAKKKKQFKYQSIIEGINELWYNIMEFIVIKNKGTTATCNNMEKILYNVVLKDQASHGLFYLHKIQKIVEFNHIIFNARISREVVKKSYSFIS